MQRENTAAAMPARELSRAERAFAEAGLLPDDPVFRRELEALHDAASTQAADGDEQDAALLLARSLLALAPAVDPVQIARLADRLAAEFGVARARVARTLLIGLEPTGQSPDPTVEALLSLLDAGDKRLTRLGFDLHDGPLQELLLLGEDMRMFREQLASVLGEREEARLLRGRLDDLEARSVELERGLRQISRVAGTSVPTDRPFVEAVRELTDSFTARTGIVPAVRLEGAAAGMSPSQRIALLSVVGEALNNIREHSRTASKVEISIRLGADGVGARVRDDGCGFDVEAALLGAARRGRIGLAGIYERVRLLDGECVVESQPGGPTTVSLKLPRWEMPGGSTALAGGG